jgi:hypothetical protein
MSWVHIESVNYAASWKDHQYSHDHRIDDKGDVEVAGNASYLILEPLMLNQLLCGDARECPRLCSLHRLPVDIDYDSACKSLNVTFEAAR